MQTLHLQFYPKCTHLSPSTLSWGRSHPNRVKNDNKRESEAWHNFIKINAYMYVSSFSMPQLFQSLHVIIVQLNLSCLEILGNSRRSD